MRRKCAAIGAVFACATAITVGLLTKHSVAQGPTGLICGIAAAANNVGELGAVNPAGLAENPSLARDIELDCSELRNILGVRTRWLLLEEKQGFNAFAFPRRGDDGFVYLGHNLIRSEIAAGRSFAIPGIIGHEFAHIEQARRGMPWAGKLRELHADFCAGWFIAYRNVRVGSDGFAPWFSVMAKGDNNFNSPMHHGTPEERGAAFSAGFNSFATSPDPHTAYWRGVNYIRQSYNIR